MKIGYTTGVFDMFHIGHLNILKNAKSQCDYLIVGISTDEVVLSYKKKRPIITFNERIEIVRSIKYVDEVIPQINMDKVEAWNRLHFNVLFHGSDWKDTEMYKSLERQLEFLGVEVVYLPHTEGTSSTKLSNVLDEIYGRLMD